MDFRAFIREQVTLEQHGLEIGPLHCPIVSKAQGYNVIIMDHADKEMLRKKYKNNPGIDIDRLEDVDIVDHGCEIKPFSRDGQGFDYIISSHNLEHTTDPIYFLQRMERALKPGGKLYLLIPDKRRCFDYFRPISTCGQMLDAYKKHSRRHGTAAIYDYLANAVTNNGNIVWDTEDGQLRYVHSLRQAFDIAMYETEEYFDAHAWVFTPSSFSLILHDLNELNLLKLGVKYFHESIGCEFFMILSCSSQQPSTNRLELAKRVLSEQETYLNHL